MMVRQHLTVFISLLSLSVCVPSENNTGTQGGEDGTCPPRDVGQAAASGLFCSKSCRDDGDCVRRKCRCDGACGRSCVSTNRSCPWPVTLDNAMTELRPGSRPVFGHWMEVRCKPGFRARVGPSDSRHRCQGDRRWSGPLPVCEAVLEYSGPCGAPPEVTGGFHEWVNLGSESRSLQYACHPGYALHGTASNVCLDNGKWASGPPVCKQIFCGPPRPIGNGVLVAQAKGRFRVNETVYHLCKKGFTLEGPNEASCTPRGTWSAMPTCQASCNIVPWRSRVKYQEQRVWLSSIPGGTLKHREELHFYCFDEAKMCSYPVKAQCLNGHLQIPTCYKEPTWVRFTMFTWKIPSEMQDCSQQEQQIEEPGGSRSWKAPPPNSMETTIVHEDRRLSH